MNVEFPDNAFRVIGREPIRELRRLISRLSRLDSEPMPDPDAKAVNVVIGGAFSSGKSAFVNYLIGDDVAVEGVLPTTRNITEYFYSEHSVYYLRQHGSEREISRERFEELSSQGKSDFVFRVGSPSKFLEKFRIRLTDTPGLDNSTDDTEAACGAIHNADALIWLVAAEAGTLRDTECKFLKQATCVGERRVPMAVLLSQVDLLKPPSGGTLADSIRAVRSNVVEKCEDKEYSLRLICPPVCFTSKPEGKNARKRSVEQVIAHQRDEIETIVERCRGSAVVLGVTSRRSFDQEREACRKQIHEACASGITTVRDARDRNRKLYKRRHELLIGNLSESIENAFAKYLPELGKKFGSSSRYISSWVCKEGIVWDSYAAKLLASPDCLDSEAVDRIVDAVLKERTDCSADLCSFEGGLKKVMELLSEDVGVMRDDSWYNRARSRARDAVANRTRTRLRRGNFDYAKVFATNIVYPRELSFKDVNLTRMRETADAAEAVLGVLRKIDSQIIGLHGEGDEE